MKRIYLDNNATTFCAPSVSERFFEVMKEDYGNPSSIHSFGQEAKALLTKSRTYIADFLKVKPHEIIFGSGATELLNLLIKGVLHKETTGHVISSDLEHPAVYNTLNQCKEDGYQVEQLSGGSLGAVQVEQVREAIRPDTKLIVLMAVNNESGVKTDYQAIASLAEEKNIPFIVDAVALMGKEKVVIPKGVSAMTFSAHKFHGPKGFGFAFIRSTVKLKPFFCGGGQEYHRRSGTENLPAIAATAEALRLIEKNLDTMVPQISNLRDLLEKKLREGFPELLVHGQGERICNVLSAAFPGVDGESLLMNLDLQGIAVSHGSACSAGALEPSRVILNMGVSRDLAHSTLRLSLSRYTTKEEIERAAEIILNVVHELQKIGC